MNRNTNAKFDELATVNIPRSKLSTPQKILMSGMVGDIVPFYRDEVYPGDTKKIKTNKVIRFNTPKVPFMDALYLDTMYFFVPNRLIWKHWQNFMGESESAWYDADVEYTVPQIEAPAETGWAIGGIADGLGYPTGVPGFKCSALPIRAYAKICEDWFRSEPHSDPLFIDIDDSDQTGTNDGDDYINDVVNGGKCFKARKLRDYFVSALPQPQFGDPVSINLGNISDIAPVVGNGKTLTMSDGTNIAGIYTYNGDFKGYNQLVNENIGSGGHSAAASDLSANKGLGVPTKEALESIVGAENPLSYSGLEALVNISSAPLITINELRLAFQVQKWQENTARAGSRYIEIINSHFAVQSPDARLQRSEYLGGNRIPVQCNQVLSTAGQEGAAPGNLGKTGAYSLTTDINYDFEKSFTEHGYIIGVMIVRYHHTYQQGCEKDLLRKDKFQYFWPEFSNIGEQQIKNAEIYCQGPDAINEDTGKAYDDEVFGYQEAWAELRYKPNRVFGYLKSDANGSLDTWHLADDYQSLPYLSDEWIREDANTVDRILTVTGETAGFQYFGDIVVENEQVRTIPTYSIPGLMDHH